MLNTNAPPRSETESTATYRLTADDMRAALKHQEEFRAYSEKVGEVVRQLAFAGIALVWLFRREEGVVSALPILLVTAAIAISITLLADLSRILTLAIASDRLAALLSDRSPTSGQVARVRLVGRLRLERALFLVELAGLAVAYTAIIAFLAQHLRVY